MLVSYPLVRENGSRTGAEVTMHFNDIRTVEQMTRWVREEEPLDGPATGRALVPGCISITLKFGREFEVEADYNQLKEMLREFGGWYD